MAKVTATKISQLSLSVLLTFISYLDPNCLNQFNFSNFFKRDFLKKSVIKPLKSRPLLLEHQTWRAREILCSELICDVIVLKRDIEKQNERCVALLIWILFKSAYL